MPTKDLFNGFDPAEFEDEVEERWGGSDAYEASKRRTSGYSEGDWAEITAEADDIADRLAAAMAAGQATDSTSAMDLAEEHRRHIDRRFYDCSHEMHVGLAEMYVADTRFTEYWDARSPGLAIFVRDAVIANAARS